MLHRFELGSFCQVTLTHAIILKYYILDHISDRLVIEIQRNTSMEEKIRLNE